MRRAEDRPLRDLALGLGLLVLLRLLIGYVPIPLAILSAVTLLVSALFVLVPVAALFRGSAYRWTWGSALGLAVLGAALQFGLGALVPRVAPGLGQALIGAVSQTGLLLWCLGLGAALCLAVREKNLLVPVAIFLVFFDVWLVFVPEGIVNQLVVQGSGQQLAAVAHQVPQPRVAPTGGLARPMLYVGPADFLFMSMFFAALHRYGLRARQTALWLGPVLVAYLLIVLGTGVPLPALVPIGLVLLLANWREFHLTRDERQTTVVLTVVLVAVLGWRMWVNGMLPGSTPPASPPERERSRGGPEAPAREARPAPTAPDQSPS